ncbi:Complex 1 protein (LYR family) [Nesidiocoris tenuis]|uniref:Complex 1 protein (LYR family) n=1 Tax=Nesidiocoris tenuis TaxID=355587 RepID=A0ABN7BA94_9HEMI|nr:Complex 1 protein (LYR family) [Nesidiocoris tenuis]
MARSIDKTSVLQLYKTILREASKFPAYNFRMYCLRRARDGFRLNKGLNDQRAIEKVYTEGQNFLNIIKRQAVVYTLYKAKNLVIENERPKNST